MRKTTPGIDRIQMQSLRAQKAWLEGSMSKHFHLCHKCNTSQGDVFERCAEWWQMAKRLHKLKRLLRRDEQEANPDQMTLPGMESP